MREIDNKNLEQLLIGSKIEENKREEIYKGLTNIFYKEKRNYVRKTYCGNCSVCTTNTRNGRRYVCNKCNISKRSNMPKGKKRMYRKKYMTENYKFEKVMNYERIGNKL